MRLNSSDRKSANWTKNPCQIPVLEIFHFPLFTYGPANGKLLKCYLDLEQKVRHTLYFQLNQSMHAPSLQFMPEYVPEHGYLSNELQPCLSDVIACVNVLNFTTIC